MYTGVRACSLPNFSLGAWEVTAGGLKKQKLQTKAPFYQRRQADGTWQAASGRRLAGACVSAILGLKKKKKMPLGSGQVRVSLLSNSSDKCCFGKWSVCVVVSAWSFVVLDCLVKCVEVMLRDGQSRHGPTSAEHAWGKQFALAFSSGSRGDFFFFF